MTPQELTRLTQPPAPTPANTIWSGPGFYRYVCNRWRLMPVCLFWPAHRTNPSLPPRAEYRLLWHRPEAVK